MGEHVKIWLRRLQSCVDRWWYFPLLGFLAGLDLFILVVPTDAILVSSVLLRPRKWISAFFWVGLGAGVGALVLAGAIQGDTPFALEKWFPEIFRSDAWKGLQPFFDQYGAFALAAIALSPLVQFPIVVLAAMSGMPLLKIFLICLVARTIKAAAISYAASHAPKLLMKVPFLKRELAALELPVPVETPPPA